MDKAPWSVRICMHGGATLYYCLIIELSPPGSFMEILQWTFGHFSIFFKKFIMDVSYRPAILGATPCWEEGTCVKVANRAMNIQIKQFLLNDI